MHLIPCPNCGARPTEEFRFGGEVPAIPDRVVGVEARDVDLVWFSNNVDGPSVERWYHLGGCKRWLTLARDTHTDTVLGADST